MLNDARHLLVVTLALVAIAGALCAGCTGSATPATGAYLVRPGPDAPLDPDIGPYDADRVDPEFTDALGEFIREVRGLELADDATRRVRMSVAIARLADAMDEIPLAKNDPHVRAAVAQLRVDHAHMASAVPGAGVHALLVASSALLHVADQQYDESPLVVERARDLSETVERLRDARRLRQSPEEMLAALREAARVLTAMHASIAWGTVRD